MIRPRAVSQAPITVERDSVDLALEEILELPHEDRRARLAELESERPEDAPIIRRRLARLQLLGIDVMPDPLDVEPQFPERLGEFRIKSRLGGGGMGVVFLAEQTSLGRDVALKVLRAEHLFFPGAHERFRREVEAIARLEHPGIVPIYTVGEDGGVPYFAMELLRGATLAEVLADLEDRAAESLTGADLHAAVAARAGDASAETPPAIFASGWIPACLDLCAQVADALAHAHGRGILHRDVKPSNVVVTPDGRARLLDFGLTSSGETSRVTRTGSQLGTLHYMSPEQVKGSRGIDGRTDVYSLGVTLYELLTLQVPYRGEGRSETERLILDGRPDAIRSRNRKATPEVEVVCLAAMDVDPAHRYASAATFAADLRAALELRPVSARPPGPLLRLRRSIQRRPGFSAAVALGFVAAAGIPTALFVQEHRYGEGLRRALEDEKIARADATDYADEARLREVANTQIRELLFDIFREAHPDRHRGKPGDVISALDAGAAKIEQALPSMPTVRAKLMTDIASVYNELGAHDKSLRLAEPALELMRSMDVPQRPVNVAFCLHVVTKSLLKLGRVQEAEPLCREAVELRRGAADEGPFVLALALNDLSEVLRVQQRFDEAEAPSAEAIGLLRRISEADPVNRAYALECRAQLLLDRWMASRPRRPVAEIEESRALIEEALAILGPVQDRPIRAAEARMLAGLAEKLLGRLPEARAHYEHALETFRTILGEEDSRFARTLFNHAELLDAEGRLDESLTEKRRASELLAKLHPDSPPTIAATKAGVAKLLYRMERYDEARSAYEELIPLQIAAFGPESPYLASSYLNVGDCHLRAGALEEAEESLTLALERNEKVQGAEHLDTTKARVLLARLRIELGEAVEAEALLEEALRVLSKLPADDPRRTGCEVLLQGLRADSQRR